MIQTLRDADLDVLAQTLHSQRARALDVVVQANQLRSSEGRLVLLGTEKTITEDGVSDTDGCYLPTEVGDEGLASKLDIPLRYLRRLRAEHIPLLDANLNGWLLRDNRKFLVRVLRDESAGQDAASHGVVRAVLSDGYRCIDNLDVVLAALAGVRGAGLGGLIVKADLTQRRMYVRVTSPAIAAQAVDLVRDYRDPLTGRRGPEYPLMFAGFVFSNSEVGEGAFNITPRVVLQVCTNGQTVTKDAMRKVHAGARLDEGVVEWSDETHRRNLDLITSQVTDAVRKFMSLSYVESVVSDLCRQAGIEVADPASVVTNVSKRLGFTAEQQADILNAFIRGGDATTGGVMHAVTYVAQQQPSGDVAADMEDKALQALELAYLAARPR